MARITKIEMFVVDASDTFPMMNTIDWEGTIENSLGDVFVRVNKVHTKGFEWDDELPINKLDSKMEEFEKYFE